MAYLFLSRNLFFMWLVKAMWNEVDVSEYLGNRDRDRDGDGDGDGENETKEKNRYSF